LHDRKKRKRGELSALGQKKRKGNSPFHSDKRKKAISTVGSRQKKGWSPALRRFGEAPRKKKEEIIQSGGRGLSPFNLVFCQSKKETGEVRKKKREAPFFVKVGGGAFLGSLHTTGFVPPHEKKRGGGSLSLCRKNRREKRIFYICLSKWQKKEFKRDPINVGSKKKKGELL